MRKLFSLEKDLILHRVEYLLLEKALNYELDSK